MVRTLDVSVIIMEKIMLALVNLVALSARLVELFTGSKESQCTKYHCVKEAEDKRQKVLTLGALSNNLDCGDDMKNVHVNLVAVGFDKEWCRKALTRMIIVDELSFSFVEKEGFRDFCRISCPRFTLPSRRTLDRDIFRLIWMKSLNSENILLKKHQEFA
ncbi:hypothetical protein Ddye_025434 [Dipteronia dyeriana]|uniref:Uncharacterized protein n=1 Tax=Dipteronia dyeriana TaxID=168575 RepID=A0AAD9TL66_9ROSI|nr:hypothetical protein Ddye_025434 [Dipteronia dyeriana]